MTCVFCAIARGEQAADLVLEAPEVVAFLDHRPLLHGHVLIVPRAHVPTFDELPPDLTAPLFAAAQLLSIAVQRGLAADGSFTAVNTRVSQSVPHLHVHVVPRWKGDGLFSPKMVWKRTPYRSAEERRAIAERIRAALAD